MFRRLYRRIFPFSAAHSGVPGLARDSDGRFAPTNRPRIIDAALQLRAEVERNDPEHIWRTSL